ncbi:hypothetical protein BDN72DRAFT_265692 [Pluteus cervinus]|uniref:Uncharacterized protein n=1 Tax=Pluteus cervinus TaxID=181527 RepID=A0ACD3AHT3_9AGAR|nr:hypothetical protein BDN72DRAFT_265692 [Pluteus cervinus]
MAPVPAIPLDMSLSSALVAIASALSFPFSLSSGLACLAATLGALPPFVGHNSSAASPAALALTASRSKVVSSSSSSPSCVGFVKSLACGADALS